MKTNILTDEQKTRLRSFIKSLRTTKKSQGHGSLNYYNREDKKRHFCCLGIACEVAIKDGLELEKRSGKRASGVDDYVVTEYKDFKYGETQWNGSTLPVDVVEWYGLPNQNPELSFPTLEEKKTVSKQGYPSSGLSAATVNDSLRFDFKHIADLFEYNYLPEDYAARHPNTETESNDTHDESNEETNA